MIDIIIWIIVFLVSLTILVKASDYFTDSAETIGLYLKIPKFIIGVTIVAIGTSLPELVSSIIAVMQNNSEIVAGTVIGSNITNIFLIIGVAAILSKKLQTTHSLISVDLPILMASAFFLTITAIDGTFNPIEGILAIIALTIYLLYTVESQKKNESDRIKKEIKGEVEKTKKPIKEIIILLVSGVFIFLGAKYTIDSVIEIATIINIAPTIIAATIVALGTSLPELAVSISAARKGKHEMAIGNILGSNIFNTFAVMGIPALFGTLIVPDLMITYGLPIMIVATILYLFITQDKEITKWEGATLIILYILYIGKLINLF